MVLRTRSNARKEMVDVLDDRSVFESRGEIEVKGKGLMHTYFLNASRDRVSRSA
jgi:hypothetical protein